MKLLSHHARRITQYMLLAFFVLGLSACDSNIAGTEVRTETDIMSRLTDADFATLSAAVDAAQLTATLRSDGPLTVFAPTEAAFAKLPESALRTLLHPDNQTQLGELLSAHVVPGRVLSSDIDALNAAKSLDGTDLDFREENGDLYVNGARILTTDIQATNGVIHAIDTVLIPEWFDEWFKMSEIVDDPRDPFDF